MEHDSHNSADCSDVSGGCHQCSDIYDSANDKQQF